MFYFAYGSNMDICQTKARVGNLKIIGKAILKEYDLKFNKESKKDGSGKANMVRDSNSEVEGVIFEFTDSQFEIMKCIEKGYHECKVSVFLGNKKIEVITFIADDNRIVNNILPDRNYLKLIIDGAEMFGLSAPYQEKLKKFPTN